MSGCRERCSTVQHRVTEVCRRRVLQERGKFQLSPAVCRRPTRYHRSLLSQESFWTFRACSFPSARLKTLRATDVLRGANGRLLRVKTIALRDARSSENMEFNHPRRTISSGAAYVKRG